MEEKEVTIIGAGIVGLAIAAEVSKKYETVVLERHERAGKEVSSRNSEIIHSGIYYQKDSLKARLCVEGNSLMYDLCKSKNIPFKNTGKLIVATNKEESLELLKLLKRGEENGVKGLDIFPGRIIKKLEDNLSVYEALISVKSGIVDAHKLMDYFEFEFKENNGVLSYNSEVVGIEKISAAYKITVKNYDGTFFSFKSSVLINSAGLNSGKISEMAGIKDEKYKIHYCKGEYFIVNNGRGKLSRLIYPVPEKKLTGLGIHTSMDMAGELRLGPNAFYVDKIDYTVNENHGDTFFYAASTYLDFLKREDIRPGFAGIRPKLQGPGEDFRDFVIKHETGRGFEGLINLIGIESPGLTCSPAIAKYLGSIVDEIL